MSCKLEEFFRGADANFQYWTMYFQVDVAHPMTMEQWEKINNEVQQSLNKYKPNE